MPDVQPRHLMATLDAQVPQLRPGSALSVWAVVSQSADTGGDRNQNRPRCSAVPSLCGTADRHGSTRVFRSHVVLRHCGSGEQAARFQDRFQSASLAYWTRRANAGPSRALCCDQSPASIPMDGNGTAEVSITPPWLPDSPKKSAACGIRRTPANGTSNETIRCVSLYTPRNWMI